MNKRELVNKMALALYNEDVLDFRNFLNEEQQLHYIAEVLEKNLDGYILVKGEVIE